MAIALVSAGTEATGATSAAPAFGQSTTAGNLLILVASSSGANSLSNSDGTWTLGKTQDGTSTHATIWYKPNCGAGETAPSVTGGSATVRATLLEFSGVVTSSPVDRAVASASLSSITAAGVDASSGELMVTVDMYHYATSGTVTTTDTYNNATAVNIGNNDSGNTGNHSRSAYGITTTNGVADKNTVTQTTLGGSAPAQASLVLVSFKELATQTKSVTGSLSFVGTPNRTTAHKTTASLSFVGSINRSVSRAYSGALSFVGSRTEFVTRRLTGSLSFVGSLVKNTRHSFSAALSLIGALVTSSSSTSITFDATSTSGFKIGLSSYNWTHTCAGSNRGLIVNISIFGSGTVTGITYGGVAMQFVRADTIGLFRNEIWQLPNPASGANSIAVSLSASLTTVGNADSYNNVNQTNMVSNSMGATGSNSTAPTVSLTTLDDRSWIVSGLTTSDATMTLTDSETQRQNQAGVSGTAAMADQGPISPVGNVTASWNVVGALDSWAIGVIGLDTYAGVLYGVYLTASLALSGALSKVNYRSLSATLSFVSNLPYTIIRQFTGALSFIGVFTKASIRSFAAILNFSGVFSALVTHFKNFTATLSFSGSFVKSTLRAFSASLSFVGTFIKVVAKGLTASLSFIGTLGRNMSRALSATLSFIANMTFTFAGTVTMAFTATLAFTGSFTKTTKKGFAGTLTFVGQFIKMGVKNFTASLSFVGSLVRKIKKPLSATLSFIGNMTFTFTGTVTMMFTATLAFTGNLTRTTRKVAFTATLSFIGAWTRWFKQFLAVLVTTTSDDKILDQADDKLDLTSPSSAKILNESSDQKTINTGAADVTMSSGSNKKILD